MFLQNLFDDRHGYPGRFDIFRCKQCGFGQTAPEIAEDQLGALYTEYYPRKSLTLEEMKKRSFVIPSPFTRWKQGINNVAHYHVPKGARVLDVGCGDCSSILELNKKGCEAHGIEPDENIRDLVRNFDLSVHIGLYSEASYSHAYFDYITMSQVLEHVPDPQTLLKSFHSILKPQGRIILSVPNIDSRLRKKYKERWLNWHLPYHLNHFSKKSLISLAESAGYRVEKIKTLTPNLWYSLQKLLAAFPTEVGKKAPFFNGEAWESPHLSYWDRFVQKLALLRLRWTDFCMQGESFLVFLEKKREHSSQ